MTMGLCKHFVHNARYAKYLHRPIVIINQQYTKGEIHFINNDIYELVWKQMGNDLVFVFLFIDSYFPYQPKSLYIFSRNNHNPLYVVFAARGV